MNTDNIIKVGVGAVIIQNGKTLLTKRIGSHGENTYGSLGGHVEFGETPTEALKREAMEELGIDLENIQFLVCSNILKYNKHYVDITFTATIKSGTPRIMEPDRITSIEWYDVSNLPSPLFEPLAVAFKAVYENKSYFEITS
jgi:8-oxo-dGTP diphosphatase